MDGRASLLGLLPTEEIRSLDSFPNSPGRGWALLDLGFSATTGCWTQGVSGASELSVPTMYWGTLLLSNRRCSANPELETQESNWR